MRGVGWMVCAAACSGSGPEEEPLVVDAVELRTLGDGFTIDVRWDASGGRDVLLGVDTDYTVDVVLYDGPTEVTGRVAAAPDRYQLFLTGPGLDGPASEAESLLVEHLVLDGDLGLAHQLLPATTGATELTVTLQDLEDDKEPDLAEVVRTEGLDALPGRVVVTATYPLTVP